MDPMLRTLAAAAQGLAGQLSHLLFAPGSLFSAASLASALLIAAASLAWPRLARRKAVRMRALWRALFPRRIVRSRSSRADLGLFLFNTFPAAALLGWIVLSAQQMGRPVIHALGLAFGPAPHLALSPMAGRVAATAAMFLAYELAYWLDHFLSHKVPVLWEFHKVHHTAEVLSPLTVFRVHPVDSLVFANISALVLGVTGAGLQYLLGNAASPFALSGSNLILVVFVFLTVHLQHSHVWISFRGVAGRIFLSPAHHQVHHSANPVHFNRNFGSCLSVWDWAFGTLHLPARRREALTFGAEVRAGAASPHSAVGMFAAPFAEVARLLAGADRRAAFARPIGPRRRLGDGKAWLGAPALAAADQQGGAARGVDDLAQAHLQAEVLQHLAGQPGRLGALSRRLEMAGGAEVADRQQQVAARLQHAGHLGQSAGLVRPQVEGIDREDHVEPLVWEGQVAGVAQAQIERRVASGAAQAVAGAGDHQLGMVDAGHQA
jgi:sterol desaturase/sphingolipid hydroxylase (fatty acid hydroxylase superfamily)